MFKTIKASIRSFIRKPFEVTPMYHGVVHPRWRVHAWELIDTDIRAQFESDIEDIILMFPKEMQAVRPEIAGSYGCGRAMIMSDLEIVLSSDNWRENRARWHGSAKWKNFPKIIEAIHKLSQKWQIKIEFGFGPSTRDGVGFDLRKNELYGRSHGERTNLKARFNKDTETYEMYEGVTERIAWPREGHNYGFDVDPFAERND